MDRHILKVLEEIREQYRTTNALLQRLVLQTLTVDAADGELPGGTKLTVQSIAELEKLSTDVQDSDVRGKLVWPHRAVHIVVLLLLRLQ